MRRGICVLALALGACHAPAKSGGQDMAGGGGAGGSGGGGGSGSGGDMATAMIPAPSTACVLPVQLADTSMPDVTLGAAGQPPCTRDGLQSALDQGGIITFACGGSKTAPVTIAIATQLTVDQKRVILDGNDSIVLDGGGVSRILRMGNTNFEDAVTDVTVQRIAFANSHTGDVADTTSTDQGGAAIYRIGGALTVIDAQFTGNIGPVNGQDVAGGAIYSIGGGATIIVGSTFTGNACSNGGALGNLGNLGLTVVNSSFSGNKATGTGANPGNGGNGGAVSFDGSPTTGTCSGATFTGPATDKTLSLCGVTFAGNSAGAFGGALFRTVDSFGCAAPKQTGPATIDRAIFDGNSAVSAGAIYLHQVDLTMTSSTVSNNATQKGAGGGLWLEGASGAAVTLDLTNVTIAGNTANEGLGGGLFFGSDLAGGTFLHVSIVANRVTTAGSQYGVFAGGTVGDPSAITLENSIVADNDKPAATSNDAFNCEQPFKEGGGNVQHVAKSGGSETQKCTSSITIGDTRLQPLMLNAGPNTAGIALETVGLDSGSAAIALDNANCAPVDERGQTRGTTCCAGAYEIN